MMDDNYEDDEEIQQVSQQQAVEFQYSQKQELLIDKLIHSILFQTSKSKSIMSETLTKKLCENVGIQCNEDGFFNLLGTTTDFFLSNFVGELKKIQEGKSKKPGELKTAAVKRMLQAQDIFMCPNRVIPEMGIPQGDKLDYNFNEE